MKSWPSLILLVSSIVTQRAYADDTFKLDAKALHPQVIIVNSQPGVWFPNTDAEWLLNLETVTLPKATSLIDLQATEIFTLKDQATALDSVINDEQKAMLDLSTANTKLAQDNVDLQFKNSKWYNRPATYTIAGAALGVLITILIVHFTK